MTEAQTLIKDLALVLEGKSFEADLEILRKAVIDDILKKSKDNNVFNKVLSVFMKDRVSEKAMNEVEAILEKGKLIKWSKHLHKVLQNLRSGSYGKGRLWGKGGRLEAVVEALMSGFESGREQQAAGL